MSKTDKERKKQRLEQCNNLLEQLENTTDIDLKLKLLLELAEKQYQCGLTDNFDSKLNITNDEFED